MSAAPKGSISVGPGVGGSPGLLLTSVSLPVRWARESQQGASGAVLRRGNTGAHLDPSRHGAPRDSPRVNKDKDGDSLCRLRAPLCSGPRCSQDLSCCLPRGPGGIRTAQTTRTAWGRAPQGDQVPLPEEEGPSSLGCPLGSPGSCHMGRPNSCPEVGCPLPASKMPHLLSLGAGRFHRNKMPGQGCRAGPH